MLNREIFKQLYPSSPDVVITALADTSPAVLAEFGIADRQNRLHFFLAQIGHESGGQLIEENMNYSAKRMMIVWPGRFPTIASTVGLAGNPQALANKVYGGRMGNRLGTDDGWNYRARGLIQITGRDGYQQTGAAALLPALENQPQLAMDPGSALRLAAGFWKWKGLNAVCDTGDFVKVTKIINGGTTGLQDRFKWLDKVQSLVPWPLGGSQAAIALPAKELSLSITQIKSIQVRLKAMGLYTGSIDGIFGKLSRQALQVYQAENKLPSTGTLTQDVVDHLFEGPQMNQVECLLAHFRPGASSFAGKFL
ncbi:MAG: peptidoglycan-binding protein [Pseudomonadota bacterium]